MKTKTQFFQRLVLFASLICCISLAAYAGDKPPGMAIASAHPLATQAGMTILEQGGNAFDAAVAVTATLAVVEPYSSGLGGGGFWLLHRASDGYQVMIDGREKAPNKAYANMYLDKNGNVSAGLSINGPLASGIPGTVAAMVHIAKKYGKLPLKQSLAPAIKLARDGFKVDEHYRRMAMFRLNQLRASEAAASIFLHKNDVPAKNHTIKQKDLAAIMRSIARKGKAGFYQGRVAQILVDGVRAAKGIWTLADLKQYEIIERKPIIGHYKGIKITTAAPPSSGGIALITILNILDGYAIHKQTPTQRTHLIIEAMRRAYRDRAEHLGDPDFIKIPTEMLIHPMYAKGLRASIHPQRAMPSANLPGPTSLKTGGNDTTHFSIIDKDGNRVAATLSINYPFGSCFVPPRTGILLNDEMDDFVAKPGVPNAYGLVGAKANAIAPGKRPLSSMTPTFLDGPNGIGIIGTPGGSRIITMVLLGILEYSNGKKPKHWVSLPRFHHQYLPDHVQYESDAITTEQSSMLTTYGHKLKKLGQQYGNMQAILWDKKANKLHAASDPRGLGEATIK